MRQQFWLTHSGLFLVQVKKLDVLRIMIIQPMRRAIAIIREYFSFATSPNTTYFAVITLLFANKATRTVLQRSITIQ
jgi:hypothetical protein